MQKYFILFIVGVFLTSCGSSKKTTTKRPDPRRGHRSETQVETKEETKEETVIDGNLENGVNPVPKSGVDGYIEFFAEIAKEEMKLYGIPASITLAQGILESGVGEGQLAKKANNHFGIKCHDWKGQKVYHDDDAKGECFRKYTLPKFSYRDHSLFLSGRRRYTDLFKLPKDDYKGWAKGLRAAGYATDKKYPAKLISLVERYELYRYDGEVLEKDEKDYKKVVDKKDQHTVQKGETLYRISKKYKVSVDNIKKWNGLDDNDIFEGQVLYVKEFDRGY